MTSTEQCPALVGLEEWKGLEGWSANQRQEDYAGLREPKFMVLGRGYGGQGLLCPCPQGPKGQGSTFHGVKRQECNGDIESLSSARLCHCVLQIYIDQTVLWLENWRTRATPLFLYNTNMYIQRIIEIPIPTQANNMHSPCFQHCVRKDLGCETNAMIMPHLGLKVLALF